MTSAVHPVAVQTHGDEEIAWVLDLPGCVCGSRATDALTLADTVPLAAAEYIAWLREHGEAAADFAGWEIVERVDGSAHVATGGEFCFEADLAPLGRGEFERGLGLIASARADLMRAIEHLPGPVLDWAPPDTALGPSDPWAPEPRTVREIVRHTLQLEIYYRDGLRDGAAAGIFGAPDDAATEHARTVDLLRAMDDDARNRVYRPQRPGRNVAEDWTVRKMLRRLIAHERAHTLEILQRRTWLILGAPRLAAE